MSHLNTAYHLGAARARHDFSKHAEGRLAGQAFPKDWGKPMPPADTGAGLQAIGQNMPPPRKPMPVEQSGGAAQTTVRKPTVQQQPAATTTTRQPATTQPAARASNIGALGTGPIASTVMKAPTSPAGGGIDPRKLMIGGAGSNAALMRNIMGGK